MAGLFCSQQPFDLLQRLVRRDARRFIQQQQAIDRCFSRTFIAVCRHRESAAWVVGIVNQPADLDAMSNAVIVHESKLGHVTNL